MGWLLGRIRRIGWRLDGTVGRAARAYLRLRRPSFTVERLKVVVDPTFLLIVLLPLPFREFRLAFETVMLFTFVFLHELGHVIVARRLGYRADTVVLTPVGCAATVDMSRMRPRHELLIAVAGPAVNLLLMPFFFVLGVTSAMDAVFAARMILLNAGIFVFNLMPFFPLDGGRVLRSYLVRRHGLVQGTRMAARVGMLGAGAVFFAGIAAGAPLLCVIGAVIWIGGAAEARATERMEAERASAGWGSY